MEVLVTWKHFIDKTKNDTLMLYRNGEKVPHGPNICKEHIADDIELVELFNNQKSTEVFKCATHWRKHHHQLLRQHPNLPVFLHDWLFLLEWSYVVLFISHTKKMNSPLEAIKFLATSVEKKLGSKIKDTHQLENLKKEGEKPMRQICTGMKQVQRDIMREQKEKLKREEEEKKVQIRKKKNISQMDLL